MTRPARLRLAFAALHPEQTRKLLEQGSAESAVAKVMRGAVGSETSRIAAGVPAEVRLQQLTELGVTPVWRGDDAYPAMLRERPDAPDLLFVEGSFPGGPMVAVVGTRRCTSYGRRVAATYGAAIARAGWPLVSGLARGIDGAAHVGTVDADGAGVAVLGSGHDVLYPREHHRLARSLVDAGGAIVSEYPPGTRPEPWRFPPRNRIISGLAGAVVVVEAGVKGGALITAASALDQGVPVLATPGDIDRESSRGCNLLIRDGAHPVLDAEDLVEALELLLGAAPSPRGGRFGPTPPADAVAALDVIGTGLTLDAFAGATGLDAASAMVLVGRLEAEGLLVREGVMIQRA